MGINYIDTAEHYMNGQAERAVGEVLKGRDRSSIFLTTKLNLTMGGSSKEELKQRFQACLDRMQTDYVDCLMIHMTPRVEEVKHEGFHEAAAELKAEGRVRFLGLSNHGTEHVAYGRVESPMENVIGAAAEDGRFDVALFVYNFLQKEQGERIIEACRARDMGVTLMKTNPVGVVARYAESAAAARASGRDLRGPGTDPSGVRSLGRGSRGVQATAWSPVCHGGPGRGHQVLSGPSRGSHGLPLHQHLRRPGGLHRALRPEADDDRRPHVGEL